NVVRRELKIPLDYSCRGVNRQQRTGVKIVAGPRVSIPIRPRIASAPVKQIQFWVIRTCEPRRACACLPTVAAPGFAPRFFRPGNRPATPGKFSGLRVISVEESANARFASADANDDLSINRQRRGGECIPPPLIF